MQTQIEAVEDAFLPSSELTDQNVYIDIPGAFKPVGILSRSQIIQPVRFIMAFVGSYRRYFRLPPFIMMLNSVRDISITLLLILVRYSLSQHLSPYSGRFKVTPKVDEAIMKAVINENKRHWFLENPE